MADNQMRYLITLLLLLLPSVCFGFGVGTVGSLGSGVVVSGTTPTLVTDDFSDVNGPLSSDWTTVATIGTFNQEAPVIQTNVVISASLESKASATYTGATFSVDQYAQIDLGSTVGLYPGIMVRFDAATSNGYAAFFTTTTCEISKVNSGVISNLGAVISGLSNSGKTVKITAIGDELKVYANGVLIGTRTDPTYSSGYPGIRVRGYYLDNGLDNFEAGDL